MSGIRVTYSGLISFVVGLASVFTGIIFVLIVTRQLTPEEFGTWNLIGGLIIYVIIIVIGISKKVIVVGKYLGSLEATISSTVR